MTKFWLCAAVVGVFCGCTQQFDPRPARTEFEKERIAADAPIPRLKEGGALPDLRSNGAAKEVEMDPEKIFATYCSSCHGADGKADGPTAQAMNPKPRNFADKAWQASVDDARLMTVISKGGGAVGLSPTMPAWGTQLNADQIKAVIGKIRKFGS